MARLEIICSEWTKSWGNGNEEGDHKGVPLALNTNTQPFQILLLSLLSHGPLAWLRAPRLLEETPGRAAK